MKRIQYIIENCKNSVSIEANQHRDYFITAKEHIDNNISLGHTSIDEIGEAVYNKMIEMDSVIVVQFYPHTSNGFFTVYHYDLCAAIDKAFEMLLKTIM